MCPNRYDSEPGPRALSRRGPKAYEACPELFGNPEWFARGERGEETTMTETRLAAIDTLRRWAAGRGLRPTPWERANAIGLLRSLKRQVARIREVRDETE